MRVKLTDTLSKNTVRNFLTPILTVWAILAFPLYLFVVWPFGRRIKLLRACGASVEEIWNDAVSSIEERAAQIPVTWWLLSTTMWMAPEEMGSMFKIATAQYLQRAGYELEVEIEATER
jgi:hypothetical protein